MNEDMENWSDDEVNFASCAVGEFDSTSMKGWSLFPGGDVAATFTITDKGEKTPHLLVVLSRVQLATLGAWIAAVLSKPPKPD